MTRAEEIYHTHLGANKTRNYIFKVIVAGEGGVGKTTLVNRYATGKFNVDTRVTIGVGFQVFDTNGENDEKIKLQIWDFGGEKRFRFLLPSYCNGAHGVILAFDLTRISSLLNLSEWIQLIRENTKNPAMLLIGTKNDLSKDSENGISDDQVHQFLSSLDLYDTLFLKTSAKTGENVTDVFSKISSLIISAHAFKK